MELQLCWFGKRLTDEKLEPGVRCADPTPLSPSQLGQEDSRRSVGPTGSSYFLTPSVPYLPRLALCWARGETPARLSLRRTESQSR
ncbi:hypothetical protein JOQ06_019349 [Pogonophryne albipinna]|uniref:Uncharacterized protein n=1 Tax=Pogonophryne albipinna TaxID=1090488 RepID=A0AAD6FDX7_9TELE|nr:hypothetical protein JOQ06_019349 [Pogonophryne albipinna]